MQMEIGIVKKILTIIILISTICYADTSEKRIGVTAKTFTISMPENRTTGFVWYLTKYDTNLISPISKNYETNNPQKLMGAPGNVTWTFQLKDIKVPTISSLEFSSERSFEANPQTDKLKYTLIINQIN